MTTFTIDEHDNITAYGSPQEAAAATATTASPPNARRSLIPTLLGLGDLDPAWPRGLPGRNAPSRTAPSGNCL